MTHRENAPEARVRADLIARGYIIPDKYPTKDTVCVECSEKFTQLADRNCELCPECEDEQYRHPRQGRREDKAFRRN